MKDGESQRNLGYLLPAEFKCLPFIFLPGTWQVTGLANNTINQMVSDTEIFVEEAVTGLYLQMPQAMTKGYKVTIYIGYSTLGTDYCILLDIIGTNDSYQYVFGVDRCKDDHDDRKYRRKSPDQDMYSVTLIFEFVGVRNVTATCVQSVNFADGKTDNCHSFL